MNPFQSPNYTQTPNDLFDDLLPKMGLAEIKVILYIIRQTFGYHRDEIKISIRMIARATGLRPNSVIDGAREAEEHGLIERVQEGNKITTWRALVSVTPSDTPRIGKRYAGVSSAETQSGVKERNKEKLNKQDFEKANQTVDYILEEAKKFKYPNRDKIPEPLLPLADIYFELTGQEPRKSVLHEWLMELNEWQSAGLQPEHIRQAYELACMPDKGFLVRSPRSLTKTAVAIKSKPAFRRPESIKFEPQKIHAVPMPAHVKEKLDKLMGKMEVKK